MHNLFQHGLEYLKVQVFKSFNLNIGVLFGLNTVVKNLSGALFPNPLRVPLNFVLSFSLNEANSSSYLLLTQLYALLIGHITTGLLVAGYLVCLPRLLVGSLVKIFQKRLSFQKARASAFYIQHFC